MGINDGRYEETYFRLIKERLDRMVDTVGWASLDPKWNAVEFQLNEIFRMGGLAAVREAIREWPNELKENFPGQWQVFAAQVGRVHLRLERERQAEMNKVLPSGTGGPEDYAAPESFEADPANGTSVVGDGIGNEIDRGYTVGDEDDGATEATIWCQIPAEKPKKEEPKKEREPEKRRPREIVIINDDIL